MAGYADDLALSHVLADSADAVSMARFRALDLHVEAKPDLSPVSDASFCYSDVRYWEEAGRLEGMLDIIRRTWRNRSYGDFYGHVLVAEGAVDIMVEPELSLWDMAALVPIVTEAGGTFTDLT